MSDSTLNVTKLVDEVSLDEGFGAQPFVDTTGHMTIGFGRNLSAHGISVAEARFMLMNDIGRTWADLDRLFPWWRGLPDNKGRVMANLCFNMGVEGLATFVHFLAAMRAGNWPAAARELRTSKWWAQVGARGPRMQARLLAE